MAAGRGHLRVGRCGLDRWSEPRSVAPINSDLMGANAIQPNREIFIMDNVTSPLASPTSCVIKLDQFQYTSFQQSRLEIHSPEGKFLTAIAKPLPSNTDDDAIYQLWSQACVLELLFDRINERIKLPPRAINSISFVLGRIEGHLKKQAPM